MKVPGYLLALLYLHKKKAAKQFVQLSTSEIAKALGVSQQAISKQMQQMENDNIIERRKGGRGYSIHVTERGIELLNMFYTAFKEALEGSERELIIKGRVFTGIGEGAYYVSLQGYREQFITKLGFEPFPGTLNLKLSESDSALKSRLKMMEGIAIVGFSDGKRTYGGAKCFPATINGKYRGAALLIERTHYGDNVLEVISPFNLREEAGLRDGDTVEVNINTL